MVDDGGDQGLVPICRQRSILAYDLQAIPGAMRVPFAAPEVVRRLDIASDYLASEFSDMRVELLIWDAYRTKPTQLAIFDQYVHSLMATMKIPYAEASSTARSFVNDPEGHFPHGTGGALDLSLLIDGVLAEMGTGFDAFVPEAAKDWYRTNPPREPRETSAATNRELLRSAMEHAGFVGLENEWWHYEWGTQMWSVSTGKDPILTTVLPPPRYSELAAPDWQEPPRQPVWNGGVAQVFASPVRRSAALAHRRPGHYYARNSHPTSDALAGYIRSRVIPGDYAVLTSSGLAACRMLLQSVVPTGGAVVYDRFLYYEVERELRCLASERGWTVASADFTDSRDVTAVACQLGRASHGIDLFMCDTPRNWWLDCIDISAIGEVAHSYGALLSVDVSVQPIQDPLGLGADAVSCSLSKYPSLGMTLGGVLIVNQPELKDRIVHEISRAGNVLSPDSATTIWTQVVSLHDRIDSLSRKTEHLSTALASHPAVREVRVADRKKAGGRVGGQLSIHVSEPEIGVVAERIIGHNAMRTRSGLHLACTFGACMTTFEHFASNIRHRVGLPRECSNEIDLPPDIVRIGVGCEPLEDIVLDLQFTLDGALAHGPIDLASGLTYP